MNAALLRAVLAFPAGAASLISTCAISFYVVDHAIPRGSFWWAFGACVLASAVGAIVTAVVSNNPWPRAIYLAFGVVSFFGLSMVQAAMSDGHPDHRYPWLAPAHALATALVFISPVARAQPNPCWKGLVVSVGAISAVLICYGAVSNYMQNLRLHRSAEINEQAFSQMWLPKIFTKPPSASWGDISLGDGDYEIRGVLANPNGTSFIGGQSDSAICGLSLRASSPFATYPGEHQDHFLMRLRTFLRKQGCTEQLISGLRISSRTNEPYCEFRDVPRDPGNPMAGKHSIFVYSQPRDLYLSFQLIYSDANGKFIP